ncbi:MAG: SUMF1/EgtB/PvdO family nonheme iron enzyme [Vicinamibacteria bacterium]|nr:SUMF1/EgtB/PvdO family nonheme iron enzyme [Vicinamibacteria bacterium]
MSTKLATVGAHRSHATPASGTDSAGNVWEWTSSEHGSGFLVRRGGAWDSAPRDLRVSSRDWVHPSIRGVNLGFRVPEIRRDLGALPLPLCVRTCPRSSSGARRRGRDPAPRAGDQLEGARDADHRA